MPYRTPHRPLPDPPTTVRERRPYRADREERRPLAWWKALGLAICYVACGASLMINAMTLVFKIASTPPVQHQPAIVVPPVPEGDRRGYCVISNGRSHAAVTLEECKRAAPYPLGYNWDATLR